MFEHTRNFSSKDVYCRPALNVCKILISHFSRNEYLDVSGGAVWLFFFAGGSGNREINHSLWNQGKSYNIVLSPHC